MQDFFNLLDKLNEADVDFVIVGGLAGAIHGCTVVTEDIDICCSFTAENLFKLHKALAGLNPVHRMTPNKLKFEITKQNCKDFKNLYIDTDLGQLDCISSVQGIGSFDSVKAKSKPHVINNKQYNILQIDDLILSKKAMNRPKDNQAVNQLEIIKQMKSKKEDS
ncbi:MAG: nucleotidyltransferase [Phycisphaerae bacterium]